MPELLSPASVLIVVAVLAYLLGSIPFGMVITRAMGLGDLRQIGSGNIGATNVLRTGNKRAALATLVLDGAKGAVALSWPVALAVCATWAVTAAIFRMSSLAALVAAASSGLWLFAFGSGRMLFLVLLLTLLIYIRHWANLERIKAGTEPKIGAKTG
jgi:glycerol-3-phosphate acyltransferase PlsY